MLKWEPTRVSHRFIVALMLLTIGGACGAFDYPMHAEPVAEDVYAIITPTRELPNPDNGGWNSNMAFVVTDAGVLLFDSGSSEAIGEAVRSTIASITDEPVRWIINSHAHGDHWLGNAAFKDSVKYIMASDTVAELISNDGERWVTMFQDMTAGITADSQILAPDRTITEDQTLSLGGLTTELLLSGGGHSPGDLMLWLPEKGVLIAGDVIYSDRMPSTNAGDLAQWIDMLARLRDLNPDVVIPGHGAVTDNQGVRRLHSLLTTLWQEVEVGIDNGLSDFEMLPQVSAALESFKPYYPGLEDKLRRDLPHVYLQVEAATF